MTEGKRIRLFVAARVPEPQLLLVKRASAPIKAVLTDARWTPTENQHLTLKFLGSTAEDLLEPVIAAIETVTPQLEPAVISLSDFGAFPGARRARVLWVGVDDPEGLLTRLAEGLDEALRPLGFEPEKRKFTPHLTLARLRTPANIADALEGHPIDAGSASFLVESIDLFSSKLSPYGAQYKVLNYFPLGGRRMEGRRMEERSE